MKQYILIALIGTLSMHADAQRKKQPIHKSEKETTAQIKKPKEKAMLGQKISVIGTLVTSAFLSQSLKTTQPQ